MHSEEHIFISHNFTEINLNERSLFKLVMCLLTSYNYENLLISSAQKNGEREHMLRLVLFMPLARLPITKCCTL